MELREYLRGLRRHWLAIGLMTLVGLAAAFGWFVLQTPVYQATAIGLVQTRVVAQEQEQNENLILVPQFDSFARSKVPTYMEMATWRVVAEGVIADLGLDAAAMISRPSPCRAVTKKADVAEHPTVFHHVGLLTTELTGRSRVAH